MTRSYLSNILFILISVGLFCCQNQRSAISSNHLANASSPYLREHADNPVNWFEWGGEALEKAAQENKPIIISIGYAACHWCHVMEEESFMDTAVARIMNENFISIKVDREERPDIDQIYINASQLLTGQAGWPLNAFAMPNGKPFYAGTYFSKEQWMSLLSQVVEAYRDKNETLVRQAEEITKGVITNDALIPTADEGFNLEISYKEIIPGWEPFFDYNAGGLAGAPKFALPVIWEFVLEEFHRTKNTQMLAAVTSTLDHMAQGGIYDHLAGGFARYSTDAEWKVPHFEKMLYDNGQLVSLYSHAFQATQNKEYETIVQETLDFIKQEMTSPDGGFYSSLNADSEGEEGTFYVWKKPEIENVLDKKSSELFVDFYNVTERGNWENQKNVLHRKGSLADFGTSHSMPERDVEQNLDKARKILLEVRNKRVHPTRDEKILTSWNAIMMMGYIDAYWAFENQEYLDIALKNAQFMEKNMIVDQAKLWRNYSNGKASIEAFLDDYALLALAYTHLYQATFDFRWLNLARSITDYAVVHFHDTSSGFFFYTSNESDALIARKMEITDQVIPSANAVMADVSYSLGIYFEIKSYSDISLKMVNHIFSSDAMKNGPYYGKWASLVGKMIKQPYEVAIMGPEAISKSRVLMRNFLPDVLLLGGVQENLPLLENKLVPEKTIIYVCRNKMCKLPVTEAEQALKQIE